MVRAGYDGRCEPVVRRYAPGHRVRRLVRIAAVDPVGCGGSSHRPLGRQSGMTDAVRHLAGHCSGRMPGSLAAQAVPHWGRALSKVSEALPLGERTQPIGSSPAHPGTQGVSRRTRLPGCRADASVRA